MITKLNPLKIRLYKLQKLQDKVKLKHHFSPLTNHLNTEIISQLPFSVFRSEK